MCVADIENRLWTPSGGGAERAEEGEGRIQGESNMETHITICEIDSQREFAG